MSEYAQHTAIATVTTKPIVGPMILQWQGFWSLFHLAAVSIRWMTVVRSALEANWYGNTVTHLG
jgi:hypothetical protein